MQLYDGKQDITMCFTWHRKMCKTKKVSLFLVFSELHHLRSTYRVKVFALYVYFLSELYCYDKRLIVIMAVLYSTADLTANLQELNTTLLAIQSKVEENKVSADANSLIHFGKITQLENDSSLHALLIQDRADNDQNLGIRMSTLETETTANQATIRELDNTLDHLISNVSSNKDAINEHQIRLKELDADIGQTAIYFESVNGSVTKLGANTSEQFFFNQRHQSFNETTRGRHSIK